MKEPTTVQDPCNVIPERRLLEKIPPVSGEPALRPTSDAMNPHGNLNYCCGGGGGAMPMGGEMRKHRLKCGTVKAEQIRDTGAKCLCSLPQLYRSDQGPQQGI